MGYSVYVRADTKELRDKMYEFLQKNFKNICKELFNDESQSGIRIAKGNANTKYGIAYAGGRYPVGFDYASWTYSGEKQYVTYISKWMGTKIAKNVYYYDSERCDTKIDEEKLRNFFNTFPETKKDTEKLITFIMSEIKRLDKLWMKK